MSARLIRLQFPAAFKPASTSDGGADMVLRTPTAAAISWTGDELQARLMGSPEGGVPLRGRLSNRGKTANKSSINAG